MVRTSSHESIARIEANTALDGEVHRQRLTEFASTRRFSSHSRRTLITLAPVSRVCRSIGRRSRTRPRMTSENSRSRIGCLPSSRQRRSSVPGSGERDPDRSRRRCSKHGPLRLKDRELVEYKDTYWAITSETDRLHEYSGYERVTALFDEQLGDEEKGAPERHTHRMSSIRAQRT